MRAAPLTRPQGLILQAGLVKALVLQDTRQLLVLQGLQLRTEQVNLQYRMLIGLVNLEHFFFLFFFFSSDVLNIMSFFFFKCFFLFYVARLNGSAKNYGHDCKDRKL